MPASPDRGDNGNSDDGNYEESMFLPANGLILFNFSHFNVSCYLFFTMLQKLLDK
jgi:hypothetical protein